MYGISLVSPRLIDRRLNPYRVRFPRRKNDLRNLEKFETIEQSRLENARRSSALRRAAEQSTDPVQRDHLAVLANKLDACRRGERCLSLACVFCWRRHRINFANQFMNFMESEGYQKVAFLTVLPASWKLMPHEFNNFVPVKLKLYIRNQLDRSGFKAKLPIMGFVDVEFRDGTFNAHMHLLVPYKSRKILDQRMDELRSRYYVRAQHPGIAFPMKVIHRNITKMERNEVLRLVSYLPKRFWPRMQKIGDEYQPFRMQEPYFIQHLLVRDRMKLFDLRLLYGIRQKNTRFIKNVSVEVLI